MGICIFTSAVLSGCMGRCASFPTANINVEILPYKDKYVEIKEVVVYQDRNKLLVTGKARKHGPLFSTYKGHIEVAVVPPDAGPVSLGFAEYEHHPSRNVIRTFEVPFPVPANPGTKVLLTFHPTKDSDSEHSLAIEKLLGQGV